MQDRTAWLNLLGGLWLVLGIVSLLWSVLAFLSVPPETMIALPSSIVALIAVFRLPPWSQVTLGAAAALAITVGWALLQRCSWVQTILVPAHALGALYAAVAALGVYALQDQFNANWAITILILVLLTLVSSFLTIFVNSIRSTEALSWIALRTAPAVPSTCEFCGSLLDPETQLCPQCNTIPPPGRRLAAAPRRAKLMSLDSASAYWLDPDKPTRIGRGLSGNEINLSNPTVSRLHAQIEYQAEKYAITALQDSNGTYVNDSRIRYRTLQDGDEVRFGRVRFRFTILD